MRTRSNVHGTFDEARLKAAGVLGAPGDGIAWLANMVGQFGTVLEAGHLVLSGSCTRPVWASKSDTIHGDFGPLGGVSAHFI